MAKTNKPTRHREVKSHTQNCPPGTYFNGYWCVPVPQSAMASGRRGVAVDATPSRLRGVNPGIRPQPTMAGAFANSQMPVASSSQHRNVNIKAQGVVQNEAQAVFLDRQRRSNPRLPSMPGTFANSQMPISASSTLRGQNIQAQAQAQAQAVKVTHSAAMAKQSNPGCTTCGSGGRSARMQHQMLMARRMGRTTNPMYRSGSMPGSFGLASPGMSDRRGMPALRANPSYAPVKRSQKCPPGHVWAQTPDGGGSCVPASQGSGKPKPQKCPPGHVWAQTPDGGGSCVPASQDSGFAPSRRFAGSLARAARQRYAVNPDRGFGPLQRFQRSLERVDNPPPARKSRGTSDVQYGVYHVNGREEFIADSAAARSAAEALSRKGGGARIKVREYRGDGKGGWITGSTFTVGAGSGGQGLQRAQRARSQNPGCGSCMGKMAYVPR